MRFHSPRSHIGKGIASAACREVAFLVPCCRVLKPAMEATPLLGTRVRVPTMPEYLTQLFSVNPLKDILVPALAALAGLWLAARKFKNERILQEKYGAYQRVLESIESIRYWGEETSARAYMLPSVSWFGGKEAHAFYAEARRELAKQTSVGAVLLSDEFVAALIQLETALFQEAHQASEDSYGEERDQEFAFGAHATEVRKLADAHLPKLIRLARRDLGV